MADMRTGSDEMEAFYQEIATKSMDALWRRSMGGPRADGPVAPYQPAYWDGEDISRFIMRAGELVRPGPDAQRRVLMLANPGVPFGSATHTLFGNVQLVLPGEVAPSHRHTSAAIRFIMRGEGAVFIVERQP